MTDKQVIDLFVNEKKKKRDIAEITGICFFKVEYILKRAKVKRTYGIIPEDKQKRVISLFRWGYNLDEIQQDQKISRYHIESILKKEKNISKFV